MSEKNCHITAVILVADITGSSNITGSRKDVLYQIYHKTTAELFQRNNYHKYRLKSETAGDGLHIIFSDIAAAGNYALDLVDFFETFDWKSHGLETAPGIRVALHTGIVFRHKNQVTNTMDYSGHTHDLVSRIEPVTARNEVFASMAFAGQCALIKSNLYCVRAGERSLKKSAGDRNKLTLYRVCRKDKYQAEASYGKSDELIHPAPFGCDADWLWLISRLYSYRVIPVIGPELLRIKIHENDIVREVNLYDYAVKKLAMDLEVYYTENMSFADIYALCCKREPNKTPRFFKEIISTLTEECEPPEILQKLVAMKCFPGFIVTTPDDFLKKAWLKVFGSDLEFEIQEENFKGRKDDNILCNINDATPEKPFIFHIFGAINTYKDYYAVTENDMLMFSRAWNQYGSANLRNYLNGRDEERKVVMMLGCNYENWYARLFLFNLSASPTTATLDRDCGIVADNVSRNDFGFGSFLARDNFGKIFYDGNSTDFVNTMQEKFVSEQQNHEERRQVSGFALIAALEKDYNIAVNLKKQLEENQFKTFFIKPEELDNENRLQKIFQNPKAAVFIPVISGCDQAFATAMRIGAEEHVKRKEICGRDYFMMPLLTEDVFEPEYEYDIDTGNYLRTNSEEVPLTAGDLRKVYNNLCCHEEG